MIRRSQPRGRALFLAGLALAAVGCNAVLGLSDFEDAPGSSGDVTGSSTTMGSGGAGAAGSTGTGGVGGAGGVGGTGGATTCGNGRLDGTETCDGDCPEECFDADLCTLDTYGGSPATCDVTCTSTPKVTCVPNDGCCPPGCQQGNDKDCGQSTLIIARDGTLASVKTTLETTGAFTLVDTFEASTSTPTLAMLMPYDSVLVYTNIDFPDPVAIGDVLADYFDGGGRVVVAPGASCSGFGIAGRFVTDNYLVMTMGFANPNPDPMVIIESNSPLMVDVTELTVELHCDGDPVSGAKVVASLSTSGDPLVVRGMVNGRGRVDVNFFPSPGVWTGDGAALLRNALLYP